MAASLARRECRITTVAKMIEFVRKVEPVYGEEQEFCRRRLHADSMLRGQLKDQLLALCCTLQRNPAAVNATELSAIVSELGWLELQIRELERVLAVSA